MRTVDTSPIVIFAIAQAIPGVDVTRAMREHATTAVKERRSQTASLASQLKLAATLSFLLSVNDRRLASLVPRALKPRLHRAAAKAAEGQRRLTTETRFK
jgi:hypothetical protein